MKGGCQIIGRCQYLRMYYTEQLSDAPILISFKYGYDVGMFLPYTGPAAIGVLGASKKVWAKKRVFYHSNES